MIKALAVVLVMSGCSVALQSKPSKGVASSNSCSTSHAYWVADALGVVAGVAAIAYGVSRNDDAGNLSAGVGAVGGVLYLASAGNGIKWRRQCERGTVEPIASR